MPSFGEKLRREREKRSITLDQISQSTKIGTRMLQALEEDKFNQLPGGIFNKGFVRAYARHLGLDEDQAVADYLEASGEAQPTLPELPSDQPLPRMEARAATSSRPLPWGAFAAILLLLALALSIWSRRQKDTQPPPTAPQLTQNQTAQTQTTQTQTTTATGSVTSNSTDRAPATPSPAKNSATVLSKTPSPATILPVPSEFVVVVQAREDSWTAIQSDGRTVYSGILAAGDQRAIRARTEVIVKAGNAGGIDLRFNGKKLDSQGEIGQVRTITFGPGGIVANAPASPPTQ